MAENNISNVLGDEMHRFTSEMHDVTVALNERTEALRQTHAARVADAVSQREALTQNRNLLRDLSTQQTHSAQAAARDVAAARREIAKSESALRAAPVQLRNLQKKHAELQNELDVDRAKLKSQLEDEAFRVQQLTKAIVRFQHAMALKFEVKNAWLQMSFWRVDPENDDNEAVIAINVDHATNEYRVGNVSPQIDASSVLGTLNQDGDLSAFVIAVRKIFVSHFERK